jgi:hypothetical protein
MIDYFFSVFLATIVITRIFLLLNPTPAPTIGNVRIHHYMYGLVGIAIALVIHSLILYAIGLGLFVDELTYLIIGGKTHRDNYSGISLSGTFILIIIVFFLRNWLTAPF